MHLVTQFYIKPEATEFYKGFIGMKFWYGRVECCQHQYDMVISAYEKRVFKLVFKYDCWRNTCKLICFKLHFMDGKRIYLFILYICFWYSLWCRLDFKIYIKILCLFFNLYWVMRIKLCDSTIDKEQSLKAIVFHSPINSIGILVFCFRKMVEQIIKWRALSSFSSIKLMFWSFVHEKSIFLPVYFRTCAKSRGVTGF